jgi:hypothetical protein
MLHIKECNFHAAPDLEPVGEGLGLWSRSGSVTYTVIFESVRRRRRSLCDEQFAPEVDIGNHSARQRRTSNNEIGRISHYVKRLFAAIDCFWRRFRLIIAPHRTDG